VLSLRTKTQPLNKQIETGGTACSDTNRVARLTNKRDWT
jgi:hypothetical protein